MIKKALLFVACPLLLFSCRHDKRETLIRNWQAVSVENSQMDAVLEQGQIFLDTMGKSGDDATHIGIYGTSNMDSLRQIYQAQLDSIKVMREKAIKNTMLTFRKNGTVVLTFAGFSDSTKWHFDDRGSLILNEITPNTNSSIKLQVVMLEDTALKLQLMENGSTRSITFHPEAK